VGISASTAASSPKISRWRGPPAEAAVDAVEAGADLLIISSVPQQQAGAYDAVESGEIPRARIEKSVSRLLEVKESYDLRVEGWH
jgi:beta-N-acetylhexosaminidase